MGSHLTKSSKGLVDLCPWVSGSMSCGLKVFVVSGQDDPYLVRDRRLPEVTLIPFDCSFSYVVLSSV